MEMRIGDLAGNTGVNIETIRYYERVGILPRPVRAANNYRIYSAAHERRLRFVRRARDLGFTLDEVRVLLRMIDGGDYTCEQVKAVGAEHLEAVRSKIADLRHMETTLTALMAQCRGGRTPDCSMLETLFGNDSPGDGGTMP
ncbi:MAG TPA: helix-turn-helix domain-containing protein [Gammaproteobacteria bacterium]|nr:helix-turn-helix domain-containing protein [Gammaproteobacteria bacterium]